MYPEEPDYDGTQEMLPALLSSNVRELTDSSRSLNRVLFTKKEAIRSLSQVDTTVHDTVAVDNVLQKGTIVCNI